MFLQLAHNCFLYKLHFYNVSNLLQFAIGHGQSLWQNGDLWVEKMINWQTKRNKIEFSQPIEVRKHIIHIFN